MMEDVHLEENNSLATEDSVVIKEEVVDDDCTEDEVPDPVAISFKITVETEEIEEDFHLEGNNSLASGQRSFEVQGQNSQIGEDSHIKAQDQSYFCQPSVSLEDGASTSDGEASSKDEDILQQATARGVMIKTKVKLGSYGESILSATPSFPQGHHRRLEEEESQWKDPEQNCRCNLEASLENETTDEEASSEDANLLQRSNVECVDLTQSDTQEENIHVIVSPVQCTYLKTSIAESHEKRHVEENPIQCSYREKRRKRMSKQDAIGHEITERRFHCSYCDKKFQKKVSLQLHERIHTGERPYQCRYCEKKFVQRNGMKVHERTHTGERPYLCSYCEKKFATPQSLSYHERTHSDQRPFQCSHCDKSFIIKQSLKSHLITHTGERPFQCRFCDSGFRRKSHLQHHERIHTGERPYECSYCEKKFKVSSHLKRHEKIHRGERPYQCNYCEKRFAQKQNLKYHEGTHTGERRSISV